MQEIGRGAKVFDAAPVRGRFLPMEGPDDVLALMDSGAQGVVALVPPIYHELTAIICTSGTVRSHIGIVSREFQVPCVMSCTFTGAEPAAGAEVELDCSGDEAVVRG
jgi:signal transduction protein with GAF and PtsI domain